ncbi:MAG: DUF2934 domain-containing protein [Steroidobacteraceae bacterium]|jgi:hypothetical protein
MANRRTDPAPAPKAEPTPVSKARANRAPPAKPKPNSTPTAVTVAEDVRRAMIAEAAYFHAQRRGFAQGDEVQDWLQAEAEIDALLRAEHGERPQ